MHRSSIAVVSPRAPTRRFCNSVSIGIIEFVEPFATAWRGHAAQARRCRDSGDDHEETCSCRSARRSLGGGFGIRAGGETESRAEPPPRSSHPLPRPRPCRRVTSPSVRSGCPKAVMADGKKLTPGTYQVRVTGQVASPDAKGQTPGSGALARIRAGRSGQGPGGCDDRAAVGPQARRKRHSAPGELVQVRNLDRRRLRSAVDQPRRQPLPGPLSDCLTSRAGWAGRVGQVRRAVGR